MPHCAGNQDEHKLTPRLSLNRFAQFIRTAQGPAFLPVRSPPFGSLAGIFESIGHTFMGLRVGMLTPTTEPANICMAAEIELDR